MPYKIAILDDEPLIRKSIRMKIGTPGFEVVFESDDGFELMDYLDKNGPYAVDLIFVDIVMPAQNGLDFVLDLKKTLPGVPVVIISGHNDFEYMQKAIQLGVNDYILKPILPENLNLTLGRMADILKQRDSELSKSCMDNISGYIVNKGFSSISTRTELYFKREFQNGFAVILTLLGNWDSSIYWFDFYKKNEWCFVYPGNPNLLISFCDAGKCYKSGNSYDYSTVTSYVSNPCREIADVKKIVADGLEEIRKNLTLGKFIVINEIRDNSSYNKILKDWKAKETGYLNLMSKHLGSGDYSRLIQCLAELFTFDLIPISLMKETWKIISIEISKHIGNEEILFDEWMNQLEDPNNARFELVSTLKHYLMKQDQDGDMSISGKDVVNEIMEYMKSSYWEDISLKSMSEKYYINRSHLSRLFKKITGRTFNDLLTEIRINKACEILNSSCESVGNVAQMVGYEDSRYFSQVFYKQAGCTPSAYRHHKNLKNEGAEDEDKEAKL